MPGHDGLWVVEQINARGIETRVVLLTAHLDEMRLLEAVRLGVAGAESVQP